MLALDYIARAHEANKASVLASGAVEAILCASGTATGSAIAPPSANAASAFGIL